MESPHLRLNIRQVYDAFDAPVTPLDCGQKCAPYNPTGKPFCCDICHAVPAAWRREWDYLKGATDLWHAWYGNECPSDASNPQTLQDATPEHMLLLACKGPALCQRPFRAVSCRQFPFFPYLASSGRFLGLAYEWDFEPVCWVISHLEQVTAQYRSEFVRLYDWLLDHWPEEYESYYLHSEVMRQHFKTIRRRIPLLHRNGKAYWISPGSERLAIVATEKLPRFGFYRSARD